MVHYSEITNLKPTDWGYSGWNFLNAIALTYNPSKKEKYKAFFSNLVLPCDECGYNYMKNLPDLDNALESKEKLLLWLLNIRNSIYKEKNRKTMTLDESVNLVFKRDNYTVLYLVIAVLIVIIIYQNI